MTPAERQALARKALNDAQEALAVLVDQEEWLDRQIEEVRHQRHLASNLIADARALLRGEYPSPTPVGAETPGDGHLAVPSPGATVIHPDWPLAGLDASERL